MAITIEWGTQIINVPKADLTLVQMTPTEIYSMDLDWFRLELKALEATDDGITEPATHNHNTEVTLGGLTFARVVEIINGYTVTFEDGQYAVNLLGANSNVGDVVNVNQVSVRSQNSAGLISTPIIEYASFDNGVTVDITSTNTGTIYPVGTPDSPVNNMPDALIIAAYRGFANIYIQGDISIQEDVREKILYGQTPRLSAVTILAGANVAGSSFLNMSLSGILDGNCCIDNCKIGNLFNVEGRINNSHFEGILELSGTTTTNITNSFSDGPTSFILDMGGWGRGVSLHGFSGGFTIQNFTGGAGLYVAALNGEGRIIIDSTCTAGLLIVSGITDIVDNSGAGCIVNTTGQLTKYSIADAAWEEDMTTHTTTDTAGGDLAAIAAQNALIQKILTNRLELADGLSQNWILYDDDDTTPLLTWDVSDKDGKSISIPSNAPAKRTRGQ